MYDGVLLKFTSTSLSSACDSAVTHVSLGIHVSHVSWEQSSTGFFSVTQDFE